MKRDMFYKVILTVLFLCSPGWVIITRAQEKNIVSFQVKPPVNIAPGELIKIEVVVDIAPGWYVYAPTKENRKERLHITQMEITRMPAHFNKAGEDMLPLSAFRSGHEVYAGNNNRFQISLQTSADVPIGEHPIEMELSYQACNAKECLPPVTESMLTTVHIGKKVLSARQILDSACVLAKKNDQKVLLMFHSSWCVWCHKMDAAINDEKCRSLFNKYYQIAHIRVWEDKNGEYPENPGGVDMLKQYQGPNSGIPFWLIFDTDGQMLADSQIKLPGKKTENMGCPTNPDHVEYFLKVLQKTSKLTENDLSVVRKVFTAIK